MRKADRIGSTILMPDLKSADDAVQPKYCYCQQVSSQTCANWKRTILF